MTCFEVEYDDYERERRKRQRREKRKDHPGSDDDDDGDRERERESDHSTGHNKAQTRAVVTISPWHSDARRETPGTATTGTF